MYERIICDGWFFAFLKFLNDLEVFVSLYSVLMPFFRYLIYLVTAVNFFVIAEHTFCFQTPLWLVLPFRGHRGSIGLLDGGTPLDKA